MRYLAWPDFWTGAEKGLEGRRKHAKWLKRKALLKGDILI